MGIKPIRQLKKDLSTGVAVLIVVILSIYQGLAQVIFEVSSENEHSVRLEFSDNALIKALETGEIKPDKVLRIYVGVKEISEIGSMPAVLGEYKIVPGQIEFKPLVSFSETLPYLAVFGDSIEFKFSISRTSSRPRTTLLEIYPTTDTLPANLLKIYLKFSGPMREGKVYKRVHIYRRDHGLVKDPFVPLQPELWDDSGHMITLWLDPGRVKRALGSRETYGPILEEGLEYTLVVDSLWKDSKGLVLQTCYSKPLYIGPADRNKPQTSKWHLMLPVALTKEPLIIVFGSPMDLSTALHTLSVQTQNGEILNGSVELTDNETLWKFTPINHWNKGKYRVLIYSKLEDLAGNNLNRVFDRDLTIEPMTPSEQEFHWVDFEVAGKK